MKSRSWRAVTLVIMVTVGVVLLAGSASIVSTGSLTFNRHMLTLVARHATAFATGNVNAFSRGGSEDEALIVVKSDDSSTTRTAVRHKINRGGKMRGANSISVDYENDQCQVPLRAEVDTRLIAKEYAYLGHDTYTAFDAALQGAYLSQSYLNTTSRWPLFLIARTLAARTSHMVRRISLKIRSAVAKKHIPATPHISVVLGVYNTIAGSKILQVITKRRLARRDGCSYESMRLQPMTFVTFDKSECTMLKDGMARDTLYIIKPSHGEKGQGIILARGRSRAMRDIFNSSCCTTSRPAFIVQEYLTSPMLIHGRKFDLRAYMLIGSTRPFNVFFRAGYVRRSLTAFNFTSLQMDGHLTNSFVQLQLEGYNGDEHVWSMSRLREYLEVASGVAPRGWVDKKLLPHMARVARLLFESARPKLVRQNGAFQLIGLDFMIERNLQIHFIEANAAPGMGNQSTWKSSFSQRISSDAFRLVHILQTNPASLAKLKVGDKANGFQLIYSERNDRCLATQVLGASATPSEIEAFVVGLYNVCRRFGSSKLAMDTPAVNLSGGVQIEDAIAAEEEKKGEFEEGGNSIAIINEVRNGDNVDAVQGPNAHVLDEMDVCEEGLDGDVSGADTASPEPVGADASEAADVYSVDENDPGEVITDVGDGVDIDDSEIVIEDGSATGEECMIEREADAWANEEDTLGCLLSV